MTSFAHRLPFGAEIGTDSVHFRLWAPGQQEIGLRLDDERAMPMARTGDGWFELQTDRATAGTSYSFALLDGLSVPDPASRLQLDDVHGPSIVVNPRAYEWRNADWRGRPWEEGVLYELHVGAFAGNGTFDAVRRKLDHFERIGVTAVELMPVADFPGRRNWGYDGVLPYAPDHAYGSPETLKALVDEAHSRGLMMFLDVVYNHFGPDGNYLHLLSPQFFTDRHKTPWGAAIDFSRREVRDFFIQNALYWLQEYRFDGLRFDAVHAIIDDGPKHFLTELAETVRDAVGSERHVHLVLENDDNQARHLDRDGRRPVHYDAQWNDDYHHVMHTLLTGESDGYYRDYAEDAVGRLGRALSAGFVYQGEASGHRDGVSRGEQSGHLPPTAMVNFIQNHDQIGNRAFGERLTVLAPPGAVQAALATLLLAPQIPMLFMGEEWGATEPFPFFCDFHDELASAVREGRRREFEGFAQFADPAAREAIPDPNAEKTFVMARLRWPPDNRDRLAETARLLRIRQEHIVPLLARNPFPATSVERLPENGLEVTWAFDEARLTLLANLTATAVRLRAAIVGDALYETQPGLSEAANRDGLLPPWSVLWTIGTRDRN